MERSVSLPSPAPVSSWPAAAAGSMLPTARRSRLRALFDTVFCFEALFALFLYSNNIKYLLPAFPIDETVVFMAASMPLAAWIVWRNGVRREAIPVLAAAFLFFGWMTLSLLWTPAGGMALRAAAYGVVFDLYCLAVGCLVLAGDRVRLQRFFVWVMGVGTLLSIKGLEIYFTHGSFMFYEEFLGTPAYLNWTIPLSAAIAAASSLVFNPQARYGQWLLGCALIGLFLAFALVGGARATLLAAVAALLVPTLLVGPRAGKGALFVPKIQILALLALLALAVYIAYLLASGQITTTLGRFFSLAHYIETKGISLRHERLSYWQQALVFWSWSPLFGHGLGSFSILYSGWEIPGTHPHNILLEILCDLGLVGFTLFAFLLVVALRHIRIARLRSDPLFLAVVMLLLAHLGVLAMVHLELALIWELCLALGLLTAARPHAAAAPATTR